MTDTFANGRRPGLGHALAAQMRVIGAVIMRESKTRFWRNRLGYVLAVAEPVVHMAIWLAVFNFFRTSVVSDSTQRMTFLITGMIPFFAFSKPSAFMIPALTANRALLFYPLVRHFDLILARWLLECATMILVAIIVLSGFIFFGYAGLPISVAGLAAAMALQFSLALGFGFCGAVFSVLWSGYARFATLLLRSLYFASGAIYSLNGLPEQYKYWFTFNPVAHGVQMFRDSYFPQYQASFASTSYVLIWAFGMMLVGLAAARVARERLNTDD